VTPDQARNQAQYARQTGRLVPEPCEVCGTETVEAHHDDYDKPLEVRWLCRRHHSEVHRARILETRARGLRNGHARLTGDQVEEIRRRHRPRVHPARRTGGSTTELAREFGVTPQYIGQLVRGEWRKDG
jgi:ribosome-binding protein aMBF1 (putative translation factor)